MHSPAKQQSNSPQLLAVICVPETFSASRREITATLQSEHGNPEFSIKNQFGDRGPDP